MSASFLVNGSIPAGPILLTPGATVTLALSDTSGAAVVEWSFVGASETTTYPAITTTGRGTASFTAPAAPVHGFGLSMVLQCRNAGQVATALLCVGTTTQIAASESAERSLDGGWIHQLNKNLRIEFRSLESFGAAGDFVPSTGAGTDDTVAIRAAVAWCRGKNRTITGSVEKIYKVTGKIQTWNSLRFNDASLWFNAAGVDMFEWGGLEAVVARGDETKHYEGFGTARDIHIKGLRIIGPPNCGRYCFQTPCHFVDSTIDANVSGGFDAYFNLYRDAPGVNNDWDDTRVDPEDPESGYLYPDRQGGQMVRSYVEIDDRRNGAAEYGTTLGNPKRHVRFQGYAHGEFGGDGNYATEDYYHFTTQEDSLGGGDVRIFGTIEGGGATTGVYARNFAGIDISRLHSEAITNNIDFQGEAGQQPNYMRISSSALGGKTKIRHTGMTLIDAGSPLDYDHTCRFPVLFGAGMSEGFVREGMNERMLAPTWDSSTQGTLNAGLAGYIDPPNLSVNGCPERWIGPDGTDDNIAGWSQFQYYSFKGTKCGDGCTDTTRTNDSPWCALLTAPTSDDDIRVLKKITGPLPQHLLGCYATYTFKYKKTSGGAVTSNLVATGDITGNLLKGRNPQAEFAVESGFTQAVYHAVITQDMIDNGMTVAITVLADPVIYLSSIGCAIGDWTARYWYRASEVRGVAAYQSPAGAIVFETDGAPAATTDPIYGKPWVDGDFGVQSPLVVESDASGSFITTGYSRMGGLWVPIQPSTGRVAL